MISKILGLLMIIFTISDLINDEKTKKIEWFILVICKEFFKYLSGISKFVYNQIINSIINIIKIIILVFPLILLIKYFYTICNLNVLKILILILVTLIYYYLIGFILYFLGFILDILDIVDDGWWNFKSEDYILNGIVKTEIFIPYCIQVWLNIIKGRVKLGFRNKILIKSLIHINRFFTNLLCDIINSITFPFIILLCASIRIVFIIIIFTLSFAPLLLNKIGNLTGQTSYFKIGKYIVTVIIFVINYLR